MEGKGEWDIYIDPNTQNIPERIHKKCGKEEEEEQDFFSSYSCFLLPFHKNKLSNFYVLPRNP